MHAGETLVGTATSYACRMAVPGGAVLDTAAVTQVGVRADHTRRGLLTALMRAQLDDVAARGEVLAALHATEARIYGRFGYGVATRAQAVRVRRSGHGLRPTAPRSGEVRVLGPDELDPVSAAVHERIALDPTGNDHARGDVVAFARRTRPPRPAVGSWPPSTQGPTAPTASSSRPQGRATSPTAPCGSRTCTPTEWPRPQRSGVSCSTST